MMKTFFLAALACLLLCSCTFQSTARRWNERVDERDETIYYTTTTKVGLQLLVLLPFLGDMGIDGLVNDLTSHVRTEGGDHLRVVQGSSENYWYGWPPFTWILTPVISTVSAEYTPTPERVEQDRALVAEAEESTWNWLPWNW